VANKYTRKGRMGQEAQAPDEFVSFWTRAYDYVLPHTRAVAAGLIAAVVLIAGAWVFSSLRDARREDATEMFTQAMKTYDAELLAADAKPEEGKPAFKTAEERGNAALKELDAIAKKHSISGVAREARFARGAVLFDLGRYSDAEKEFGDYVEQAKRGDPMALLAREDVGLAFESRNDLDRALEEYRKLEKGSADYFRDRALYDQARVLKKKGDGAGAEKIYKELVARTPASPLRDEAQGQLALLGSR
jgi:hypothetical protein